MSASPTDVHSRAMPVDGRIFHGQVDWGEGWKWCGHDHRNADRARTCARRLARAIQRRDDE